MAEVALGLIEHLLAPLDDGVVDIATCRHGQSMEVEVHIFHVVGRDIELVVCESHHRALVDLTLSLADFLRIAGIGHTHVGGEAEFDGQVGMLGFVARESELSHTSFDDVVCSATDAILRVVATGGELFDFVAVESHHLPHTDMT